MDAQPDLTVVELIEQAAEVADVAAERGGVPAGERNRVAGSRCAVCCGHRGWHADPTWEADAASAGAMLAVAVIG